ncbi:MAG: two-component system sensor histidine kinase NtrB [Thermodesulfobacteriota bacterium]
MMSDMLHLPLLPVYLVDAVGSALMIFFAIASMLEARRLLRRDPQNVLWAFFFWLTITLCALAISRSFWHLLRFFFLMAGKEIEWRQLAPFSGSINTLAFCAVAMSIFYYHSAEKVIATVRRDADLLRQAHRELAAAHEATRQLNQTLEERVERRTHALRVSEEKFRSLFEASKDMIFFCDREGRICDINDSGLDLLAFPSRDQVVGRPLGELFPSPAVYEQFAMTLAQQGHVKDFEVQLTGGTGAPRCFLLTTTAITNAQGEVQGCETIAIDFSHIKEVTAQLIQSEKMTSVGQLAAGVAHEINTPLGIILGYTQLLAEDFVDNQEVSETLGIIEKQTKICRRIVADLLKFSHPAVEQAMRPDDVNKCLVEVLAIVEHTLNMDHIFIHRCLAQSLPQVMLDAERLRQVFVNLINNAHYAIGNEGIIGVWSRHLVEEQEVEVIVADTGAGIPPEVQNRIFDPFFTTKGVGKGTGLGLSVSFGIVKDHGGRIEAFSPPRDPELLAVDMHTAFHIRLPVLRRQPDQEE